MENAKHIGGMWALAVALGVGLAVASTPAVAVGAPGDSGKGASSEGSASSEKPSAKGPSSVPKPHRRSPKKFDAGAMTSSPSAGPAVGKKRGGASSRPAVKTTVVGPSVRDSSTAFTVAATQPSRTAVVTTTTAPTVSASASDPDFISSTHNLGLFSVTSAADPDDNHFVAFTFSTLIFTFVLTSGTDPEDNLGFGAASTGVAGHTVGTVISPFGNFSVGIPVTDPFAELFTSLVRAGF
jgi:hypothetical protein